LALRYRVWKKEANPEMNDLYQKAKERWGLSSQISMLAEESSELSVASLHLLRKIKDKAESWEKFAEEIADVEFMIDEMKAYFPILQAKINLYHQVKEARLKRLLDGETK
jgi:hypothetical protein